MYLPTLVSPMSMPSLSNFAMDAGRTPADSHGSSYESVAESLWTPVDARVGPDELSSSRTAESSCGASQ
jgi:hypothetical protein